MLARLRCYRWLAIATTLALIPLFPLTGISDDSRSVSLPFKDMGGKKVKLSDLRGKPVLVNFWATWCVPCRAEMPLLVQAEREYGPRGISFVAVSLDDRETRSKIPGFVGEFKIDFPVWTGASTMDLDDLKLGQSLPATIFLNRDGRIVARILGQAKKDELYERLNWLAENPSGREAPRADVRHDAGSR